MAFVLGCLQGQGYGEDDSGVASVRISAQGVEEGVLKEVERNIGSAVLPFPGVVYKSINVTAKKQGGFIYLEVTAALPEGLAEGVDRYSFIYDPGTGEFTLKGYSLEALPPGVRGDAIVMALQSERLAGLLESNALFQVEPTVKRILPVTSEKFYQPKTLFSVTWRDYDSGSAVSALVDLEGGGVIQVWSNFEYQLR